MVFVNENLFVLPQDNWYASQKMRENVSLSVIAALVPLGGVSFFENGTYSRKAEMRNRER